jgi:uncharacterized RDD family membrane protein YckC
MDDPEPLLQDAYRLRTPDPWETVTPARFGIRFLARAIDILFFYLVSIAIGIGAAVFLMTLELLGKLSPGWQAHLHAFSWVDVLTGLAGTTLCHTLAEGLGGATVGKLLCGLRVASEDLGRCRLGPALVRSLGYLVDGMFFGLIGYSAMSGSPHCQRLGDQWGHTVVVRRAGTSAALQRSGCRVALGILAGVSALVLSTVMSLVAKW